MAVYDPSHVARLMRPEDVRLILGWGPSQQALDAPHGHHEVVAPGLGELAQQAGDLVVRPGIQLGEGLPPAAAQSQKALPGVARRGLSLDQSLLLQTPEQPAEITGVEPQFFAELAGGGLLAVGHLVEHPALGERERATAPTFVEDADAAGVESVEAADRLDLGIGIGWRHGFLSPGPELPMSTILLPLSSNALPQRTAGPVVRLLGSESSDYRRFPRCPMLRCSPTSPQSHWLSSLMVVFCSTVAVTGSAGGQVTVTLHGGIHAGRPAQAERATDQAGARVSAEGGAGEATTAGARVGYALTDRWTLDGGAAWSRSTSWEGSVGRPLPAFETRTLFTSATLEARLTDPDARIGLVAGGGPALIFHSGSGAVVPARQTDIGAVLTVGGIMRLDSRFSVRLDAQQYLFSSRMGESYSPMLGGTPAEPSGTRFRHDFVMLAGLSWHSH